MANHPTFTHDCRNCRFLGVHAGADVYACGGSPSTMSVISRTGDDPADYSSFKFHVLDVVDPRLAEFVRYVAAYHFGGDYVFYGPVAQRVPAGRRVVDAYALFDEGARAAIAASPAGAA